MKILTTKDLLTRITGDFTIGYFNAGLCYTMSIVSVDKHALCRGPQHYHHPLAVYDDEISYLHIFHLSFNHSHPSSGNQRLSPSCKSSESRSPQLSDDGSAQKPRRGFPSLARRIIRAQRPPIKPTSRCTRPEA